jgi:hypothetical protein
MILLWVNVLYAEGLGHQQSEAASACQHDSGLKDPKLVSAFMHSNKQQTDLKLCSTQAILSVQ